ncbi:hypothetical protein [Altererythrobacter sp. MTPC7]|uniref:hypothetical protein n=1 Tax=Altererythrobacter sp. MTPC7 TaxID=3056567 RepID=UPI0036F2C985
MSSQEKRDELRAKIEAGEQRNEERTIGDYAKSAADSTTQFVKDHPVAAVAGVVVIGLAIGAMTRPGRRAGQKAGAIATYATEMGLAYASGLLDQAGDVARAGGDALEDFGDDLAFGARKARRSAYKTAGNTSDNVLNLSRKAARRAGRTYRDAKARVAV